MTRYQVLRRLGCGPLTAGGVAFMNWLWGQPEALQAEPKVPGMAFLKVAQGASWMKKNRAGHRL